MNHYIQRVYEPLEDGTENMYSEHYSLAKKAEDIEAEIELKLKAVSM